MEFYIKDLENVVWRRECGERYGILKFFVPLR